MLSFESAGISMGGGGVMTEEEGSGGEGVTKGGVGATSWRAEAGGTIPATSQHCTALLIHFSKSNAFDHSEG